jgi:hypothetical protein
VDLTACLIERLGTSEMLRRELGEYQKGPAIFSGSLIPEDAPYPYVWLSPVVSSQDDDTKNANVYTLFCDVGAYVQDEGTEKLVDQLGWELRRLLHKKPLRLGVEENVVLNAAPPIVAPTGDGVLGRLVQLRVLISGG